MKAPKHIATRTLTRKATMMGAFSVSGLVLLPHNTLRSALPAIAIPAPTEISCPPEAAVTNVMPIARIASSEPQSSTVIRYPERTGLPALLYPSVILKNEGSAIKLNISKISIAAIGTNI